MPSWCAWLVDAGVLMLDGPAHVEGPRVVQKAWLAVVRETELTAVECFPFVFAGRYGAGSASVRIHLALSPRSSPPIGAAACASAPPPADPATPRSGSGSVAPPRPRVLPPA